MYHDLISLIIPQFETHSPYKSDLTPTTCTQRDDALHCFTNMHTPALQPQETAIESLSFDNHHTVEPAPKGAALLLGSIMTMLARHQQRRKYTLTS